MDAIEQMMTERANQLEAIVNGRVIVHCDMFHGLYRQNYFTWYAHVKGGTFSGHAAMTHSFDELRSAMQRKVDERNRENQSAESYDVIYAGG